MGSLDDSKGHSSIAALVGSLVAMTSVLAAGQYLADTQPASHASADPRPEPLQFFPNGGQQDPRVRFEAQLGAGSIWATASEVFVNIVTHLDAPGSHHPLPTDGAHHEAVQAEGVLFALRFIGANPAPLIEGRNPTETKMNFILGNDASKWATDLPTFGSIAYRDLWPGIDLVVRGGPGGLVKYDLEVKPGADPAWARLRWEGPESTFVDVSGDLVLRTSLGEFRDLAPISHQRVGANLVQIPTRFVMNPLDGSFGFEVAPHDDRVALVIDPGLSYGTFLGPAVPNSIDVDSSGNAYVTGAVFTADFYTSPGAYRTQYSGPAANSKGANFNADVFVLKMNAAGSAPVWSTLVAGSGTDPTQPKEPDVAYGIDVDSSGRVYVGGYTHSFDWPTTTNGFQRSHGGKLDSECPPENVDKCHDFYDAFLLVLNAAGNGLVYSTYLGGPREEYAWDVHLGPGGTAFLVGTTQSADFPTTPGTLQPERYPNDLGGFMSGWVAKLNPFASTGPGSLVWSTHIAAADGKTSKLFELDVDSTGHAYVGGWTTNTAGLPASALAGTFRPTYQRGNFMAKFNPTGTGLDWATWTVGDTTSIQVDSLGYVYLLGIVTGVSPSLPATSGAFRTTYQGGGSDTVAEKYLPDASGRSYATYVGSTGYETLYESALLSDGTLVGVGHAAVFPVTSDACQATTGGLGDAVLAALSPSGATLSYATFYGDDTPDDSFKAAATDASDKIYVTGSGINRGDLHTTPGAWKTTSPSGQALLLKWDLSSGQAANCNGNNGGGTITTTTTTVSGAPARCVDWDNEQTYTIPKGQVRTVGVFFTNCGNLAMAMDKHYLGYSWWDAAGTTLVQAMAGTDNTPFSSTVSAGADAGMFASVRSPNCGSPFDPCPTGTFTLKWDVYHATSTTAGNWYSVLYGSPKSENAATVTAA